MSKQKTNWLTDGTLDKSTTPTPETEPREPSLLPCPFCGSPASDKQCHYGLVRCTNESRPHCPASFGCVSAELWNTRPLAKHGGDDARRVLGDSELDAIAFGVLQSIADRKTSPLQAIQGALRKVKGTAALSESTEGKWEKEDIHKLVNNLTNAVRGGGDIEGAKAELLAAMTPQPMTNREER